MASAVQRTLNKQEEKSMKKKSGDVSSEEAAENLSLRRSLVHPTLKPNRSEQGSKIRDSRSSLIDQRLYNKRDKGGFTLTSITGKKGFD